MKAKEYLVLVRAVEIGVERGFERAYNHADNPQRHEVRGAVEEEVLNEICEWFDFADPLNEEAQ